MSVILLHKLAMRNEQMLKLPCGSLFQVLSAMFLPNIVGIGLQLGKLSQNKKGELTFETQCIFGADATVAGSKLKLTAAAAATAAAADGDRVHSWTERSGDGDGVRLVARTVPTASVLGTQLHRHPHHHLHQYQQQEPSSRTECVSCSNFRRYGPG